MRCVPAALLIASVIGALSACDDVPVAALDVGPVKITLPASSVDPVQVDHDAIHRDTPDNPGRRPSHGHRCAAGGQPRTSFMNIGANIMDENMPTI